MRREEMGKEMKGIRADKCVRCKYYHYNINVEDNWYCGKYQKWSCRKSKVIKDYSVMKKF
jgi:hypothetical protein